MTDLIMLNLLAGDGGLGRVSFRREKHIQKGGPDGGDGGNGGNVILRATHSLSTLKKYAGVVELTAGHGENGGKRKSFGKRGEDLIIDVPVGTEIWGIAENHIAQQRRKRLGVNQVFKRSDVKAEKFYIEKEGVSPEERPEDEWLSAGLNQELSAEEIANLTSSESLSQSPEYFDQHRVLLVRMSEPGQKAVICQGGFGGRGNTAFKGSTNTTPLEAEYGSTGEKRIIILELKLLADVGFVGYPNAGKSTLLSVLTEAKPKIANYPFTTLEPHLGIFVSQQGGDLPRELILADIPGLISGASQGKGLGFQFLRHVENCSKLLFVLALDEVTLFDNQLTDSKKAKLLHQQYQDLLAELEARNPSLLAKPRLLVVNKIDIYPPKLQAAIKKTFDKLSLSWQFISAATLEGIPELRQKLIS
jgi:GTP-binding protein